MPRSAKKAAGPNNQGGYQGSGNPGGGGGAPAAPMPASAPTQTQTPNASTGLPYGEHQQLVQGQQVMPIPQVPVNPALQGAQAAAGQGEDLRAAALGMRSPDDMHNLRSMTRFPQEPVTAGLPSGPGPGPEALGSMAGARISNMLAQIAAVNGDPQLARLAEFARRVTAPSPTAGSTPAPQPAPAPNSVPGPS